MENRLLGILLPSIDGLREILQAVREKYNIPEVLPENVQLAETLFQERTLEEWMAISGEIEAELREKFSIPDLGIGKAYDVLQESASNSPELAELLGTKIDIGDPEVAKLISALMSKSDSGFNGLNVLYKVGAAILLDHLITGQLIEFPIEWINMVLPITLPPDNQKIVVAIATEASEPDELLERFRKRITEIFGEKPKIKKEHLDTAEYLAMKYTDKQIGRIVDIYLERHPEGIRSRKGARKYQHEITQLKNDMKLGLYRLQQTVNELKRYYKV